MNYRPETLAVHAGQQPDPTTRAYALPIYQTVGFAFDDTQYAADLFALRTAGNIYTRITNPTQAALEDRVTQLEGGAAALATATGAAAVTYSVLNLLSAGDNMVALSTLYGGTYALFAHTLTQFGIEVRFVDPDSPQALSGLIDERTRLVFAETMANPSLKVVDLDAWAEAAHFHGLPLIVDNTALPYLCRPFEHGADIVVHSATKYLGGHGTTMGGVIVDSGRFPWTDHTDRFALLTQPDHSYHETVWTEAAGELAYIIRARTVLLRNTGAAIAPLNAWLIMQGIQTLHLRMDRHCDNAMAVAQYLQQHDAVAWVNYPGLDDSPEKGAADRTFTGRGYGGLVSFGLKAGRAAGSTFIESLTLFGHLANIGDVRSMAIHNATTTHSQLTESELAGAGVPPEMVRLSIGVEAIDDILADLDQALARTTE